MKLYPHHDLSMFCSDDTTRPALAYPRIAAHEGGVAVVATDGHRLTLVQLEGQAPAGMRLPWPIPPQFTAMFKTHRLDHLHIEACAEGFEVRAMLKPGTKKASYVVPGPSIRVPIEGVEDMAQFVDFSQVLPKADGLGDAVGISPLYLEEALAFCRKAHKGIDGAANVGVRFTLGSTCLMPVEITSAAFPVRSVIMPMRIDGLKDKPKARTGADAAFDESKLATAYATIDELKEIIEAKSKDLRELSEQVRVARESERHLLSEGTALRRDIEARDAEIAQLRGKQGIDPERKATLAEAMGEARRAFRMLAGLSSVEKAQRFAGVYAESMNGGES